MDTLASKGSSDGKTVQRASGREGREAGQRRWLVACLQEHERQLQKVVVTSLVTQQSFCDVEKTKSRQGLPIHTKMKQKTQEKNDSFYKLMYWTSCDLSVY